VSEWCLDESGCSVGVAGATGEESPLHNQTTLLQTKPDGRLKPPGKHSLARL
jgi:hypothetical protein